MLKNNFLAATAILMLSPVIHADTLAAGAAYGGSTQKVAACYIFNAGTGPVSISSKAILREPNISLPFFFSSCGATLAAGDSCGIASNIVNNAAHSCRIVVSPSGADVRGTLEFRDANLGRVLNNVELR